MKLLIAGGGTGGHLFPAMAIAEEFKARDAKNEVLFVGTKRGIESRLLPKHGWSVRYVMSGGIKGMGLFGMIKGILKMACGAFQSVGIILGFRPSAILGMGGYASVPPVFVGKLMGVPSAIHEQNAVPGVTNRVLGKFVRRVFLSYPESEQFFPAEKVKVTGNPLRKEIFESLEKRADKDHNEGIFTLLVFGGSRGAKKLNEVISELFCTELKGVDIKLIHQTGEEDYETVKSRYDELGIDATVSTFIDDIAAAYREADLVVCRAGATSISELMAAGKPSILIPYPYAADNHQVANARSVVEGGAAIMILQSDLDAKGLSREIMKMLEKREILKQMAQKAEKMAKRDAARMICDEVGALGVA